MKKKKYQIGGKKLTKNQQEYNPYLEENPLTDISTQLRTNQPYPNFNNPQVENQARSPFGLKDAFGIIDPLAYLTIGIGNEVNDAKIRKQERQQYVDSIQNPYYFNTQENGLSTNPAYFKKGGMNCKYKVGGEPSPDKAAEMLHNPPHNQPLSDKQRKYFAWLAYGKHMFGGENEMQNGGKNFKSKEAYSKWIQYGHASKVFENTPGNQKVSIKGKEHKVKHQMGGYNEGDILELSTSELEDLKNQGFEFELQND